jgi:hypothetical protein
MLSAFCCFEISKCHANVQTNKVDLKRTCFSDSRFHKNMAADGPNNHRDGVKLKHQETQLPATRGVEEFDPTFVKTDPCTGGLAPRFDRPPAGSADSRCGCDRLDRLPRTGADANRCAEPVFLG